MEILAGRDLKELDEMVNNPVKSFRVKSQAKEHSTESTSITVTKVELEASLTITGTFESEDDTHLDVPNDKEASENNSSVYADAVSLSTASDINDGAAPPDHEDLSPNSSPSSVDSGSVNGSEHNLLMSPSSFIDDEAVFLGLRVYTHKTAPATLGSQLRRGGQKAYLRLAKTT